MGIGTYAKILKGVGVGVGKTVKATTKVVGDAVNATVNANPGGFTHKVVKGAGKAGGKASGLLFDKVDMDSETASSVTKLLGFEVNKKAAIGLGVGVGTLGVAREGFRSHNRSKLGDISAGEMHNVIDLEPSKDLEGTLDSIEEDPEKRRKFERRYLHSSTAGAEGDLVFALHNLRSKQ